MEPDYNLIGTSIDLRQVDPISQKRLLAFFNFWLSQTVRLLNDCMSQFETKLLDVDNRLRRVEVSMTLLEAKLASIPGLDVTGNGAVPAAAPVPAEKGEAAARDANLERPDAKDMATVQLEPPQGAAEETQEQPGTNEDLSKDPRYSKYFKMLQMGVPEDAVKQKMDLEGVDPSILQKSATRGAAQKAAPPPTSHKDDGSTSESEASSFSD